MVELEKFVGKYSDDLVERGSSRMPLEVNRATLETTLSSLFYPAHQSIEARN